MNKQQQKKVFQKLPHSKIRLSGTSLVVQRLRLPLPMQGAWVRSLVEELGSHMPHSKKKKKERKKHKQQKQYCNKFRKDFKKWSTSKHLKKQARKQRSVYLESTLTQITLP